MNASSQSTRIVRALASLKLAVVIISVLCVLIAWGTIVEALYDAEAAKKIVYESWMMMAAMGLLAVSLIAVMVDRWPWRIRHLPFLLAHIGILLLLFGSVLTMKYGLDGQMSIEIGKTSRNVIVPMQTDVLVYASFGGNGMTKLQDQEVDFFRHPPTEQNPLRITTEKGEILMTDYRKYVLPRQQVVPSSEPGAGPAVRFQLQNPNVSVIEWLVQRRPDVPATHDFGPAKVHLGKIPEMSSGENELWLESKDGNVRWAVFRKGNHKVALQGKIKEGDVVQTGWMGLELRLLRSLPNAREEWTFDEKEAPTPLTTSAVKVRFGQREQWMLLNDTLRLFEDQTAYLVSYLHRRIDVGFPVKLERFEMIPYDGTNKAKEYKSLVEFPNVGKVEISMNEPAKVEGLTFYQASFQNDAQGKPIASVFSVNADPGRIWKYLGSLVMSLGIVALFWFRRLGMNLKPFVRS